MNRIVAGISMALLLAGAAQAPDEAECPIKGQLVHPDDDGKDKAVLLVDDAAPAFVAFRTSLNVNTDGAARSYLAFPDAPETETPRYNSILNGVQLRDGTPDKPGKVIATGKNSGNQVLAALTTQRKRNWKWLPGEPVIDWVAIETKPETIDGETRQTPCKNKALGDQYYVSRVKIEARPAKPDGSAFEPCDQARWLDADRIPAVVKPGSALFGTFGVQPGDLVVIFDAAAGRGAGRTHFGIVGDTGPKKEVGEATPAMISAIRGVPIPPASTKGKKGWNFVVDRPVMTLIFPGSGSVLEKIYDDPNRNAAAARDHMIKQWGSGSEATALARLRACERLLGNLRAKPASK